MPATLPTAEPPELTVEQAAIRAGCSASTIARWIRAGRIASRRSPAGTRLIDRADLERFVGRAEAGPGPVAAIATAARRR